MIKNNQLLKNIISNYLFVFWMAGLNLVLVPIYLRLLGADQWGIIAICLTVQGFLCILDVGLGQIMPRDIASANGVLNSEFELYKIYQLIYLCIGLFGFIAGFFLVDFICNFWIHVDENNKDYLVYLIRIILFQFLFQFVNNSNLGFLNGKQLQSVVNIVQFVLSNIKHLLILTCLITIERSAYVYIIICVIISFVEFIIFYVIINKKKYNFWKINFSRLLTVVKNAGTVSFGVVIGVLSSQIDRVVLIKYIDSSIFGKYIVIASFGLAFAHLQYPLMRAFLPKLSSSADKSAHMINAFLAVILFCIVPCLLVFIFSSEILDLWLGAGRGLAEGGGILRLVLAGIIFNALYHVLYQLMIVYNYGKFIIVINSVILITQLVVIVNFAEKFGAIIGGISWMLSGLLQLIFGLFWFFLVYKKNMA